MSSSQSWHRRDTAGLVLILAMGVAATLVAGATNGGRTPAARGDRGDGVALPGDDPQGGPPGFPDPPPRAPFEFRLGAVSFAPVLLGRGQPVARSAATAVGSTLSGLYDLAYANPAAWKGTVPAKVWNAFAPEVRARARSDAATFTLSGLPGTLRDLEVIRSSLAVRVLLGPNGRAEAAFADLTFEAAAQLTSGEDLRLSNSADLVLRPLAGRWLIVGYPTARSVLQPISDPSPVPSPSESGSGVPG
ncbi:MAG: hypothetical protein H0W94_05640 [Actinobacteria bacterium]|nr:hypothetical protein [Actinomycetota bacterium]